MFIGTDQMWQFDFEFASVCAYIRVPYFFRVKTVNSAKYNESLAETGTCDLFWLPKLQVIAYT